MEAIIFLIVFVAAWKMLGAKKKNEMASDQRFKHELDKIK